MGQVVYWKSYQKLSFFHQLFTNPYGQGVKKKKKEKKATPRLR